MLMKMPGWREQNDGYAGNGVCKILNSQKDMAGCRAHEQGHGDGNHEIEENVTLEKSR